MEFHTDTLRIPKGNDFMTLHKVIAFDVVKKQPVEDFDLSQATDIVVNTVRNSIAKSPVTNYDILPDNILKIKWNGTKLSSGYYSVEISGVWHGVNWRIYNIKENTFWIVEANELASYPHSMFVAEGTFAFNAKIGLLFGAQADWKQENPTEADYIRNKPDIPQSLSDLNDDSFHRTVTDSEKAAWNAKYSKPSGGIPPSDLSSSVQTSLGKADTALQSFTEVDPTVPAWAKQPTKPSYTASEVGALPSTTVIPDELKDLSDDSTHRLVTDADKSTWNGKQDALVSGTNIKTINNESLLGSGNINIQGGGGGEENVIEVVKVNNVALTPDAEKAVNVSVPTKVSDLDNDSGFITGYTETDPVFVASAAHGINSSDISNWNAKGTYSKPSGGIPSTDMTEAVQTSLGKADTALQSFTETDPTVPSWAKASSKPSYTASEVGAVPTTRKVNGKALSADITLSASDVNALPSSTVIPDAQIQSDWNQTDTSAKDYIKNKPNVLQVQADWNQSVSTEPDYIKNKPTIPDAQVNANWNETSTSSKAYIQNKPTIPTESTVSGWGFTKNAGTVTGITMNNTAKTVDANGVVDLGTVITEHQNITGKQDVLVSGQNIKTINGSSVLGSGNLSTLMPITNHGTSDTTYSVTPNTLHIWGTVGSLTLTLATPTDNTIVNEYMIEFTSGSTATTLSLPASLSWYGSAPSIEANKTYQISIINNVGIWGGA